jgi:hypothetical protein
MNKPLFFFKTFCSIHNIPYKIQPTILFKQIVGQTLIRLNDNSYNTA